MGHGVNRVGRCRRWVQRDSKHRLRDGHELGVLMHPMCDDYYIACQKWLALLADRSCSHVDAFPRPRSPDAGGPVPLGVMLQRHRLGSRRRGSRRRAFRACSKGMHGV